MHHPRRLITGAHRGLSRSWLHRYDDGSEITYKIINASCTAHKEELWQFSGLYVLLNILNTFCTFFFTHFVFCWLTPSLCVSLPQPPVHPWAQPLVVQGAKLCDKVSETRSILQEKKYQHGKVSNHKGKANNKKKPTGKDVGGRWIIKSLVKVSVSWVTDAVQVAVLRTQQRRGSGCSIRDSVRTFA